VRRVVLPVAALLLAGCTTAAPVPGATPLVTPLLAITHPHALLSCPAAPAVRLDAVPEEVSEVRRCRADFHDVQGVLNKVQYVERLAGDPLDLLAAYALADDPLAAGCDAERHDPLIVWVEDAAGSISAVRAPVDGCLAPLPSAQRAWDEADWETVLVAREVASTLD
jgi:hypothetical protein